MKRGDVIVVALQGDLGKPRPAIVVESDLLVPTRHVLVCPGTSHLVFESETRRILIQPSAETGLREPTQFQIDKVTPALRTKCGAVIGRLSDDAMSELAQSMIVVLGLV